MGDGFVNNTGFRKKFMIVVNVVSAVILFGSIIYHVISGSPGHSLNQEEMMALLTMMGIATGAYTAARALNGSVEYTMPEHRQFDSTCAKVPSAPAIPTSSPPS